MDGFTRQLRTLSDGLWSAAAPDARHRLEARHRFEEGVSRLRSSSLMAEPVRRGEMVPDFSLPNARGELVRLDDLLDRAPAVLGIFPSAMSPVCRFVIAAYRRAAQANRGPTAAFAAVSPEPAHPSADPGLDACLLVDAGARVCGLFGLLYVPTEELATAFVTQGVIAPVAPDGRPRLPLLATYVVDADGIAVFAAADPDPMRCVRPEDLERALRSASPDG